MIVVGLTGSIGMGKTETGRMFERLGVPVFDADKAVHQLYGTDGAAVAPIEAAFPGVVVDGAVDRSALADRVLGDEAAVRRLEAIVHPLVQEMRARFLETAREEGRDMVVVDIPLLFETGGETRVDRTVVVSAPPAVQRQRVLARPGMTEEKFRAILARQMPDEEKRKRADFVVDSSVGLDHAFAQVERIVASLRSGG
jgi:dephospho-CoA kinase